MVKGKQLFYEDIFKKLQQKNVEYLVIGGIAVNLYGVQRATGDIDLLLSMDQDNLSSFISLTKELGLVPKMPVKAEELKKPEKLKEWRETKNMLVFSFAHPDNPYITIDVMNEEPLPFAEAYKRRKIMRAWGIDISTVSLGDLIKLKQISGREQDLADIEALNKIG
jgi:hypothetical protein